MRLTCTCCQRISTVVETHAGVNCPFRPSRCSGKGNNQKQVVIFTAHLDVLSPLKRKLTTQLFASCQLPSALLLSNEDAARGVFLVLSALLAFLLATGSLRPFSLTVSRISFPHDPPVTFSVSFNMQTISRNNNTSNSHTFGTYYGSVLCYVLDMHFLTNLPNIPLRYEPFLSHFTNVEISPAQQYVESDRPGIQSRWV